MDDIQEKLVLDLVLKNVSVESFVAQFGADPRTTPDVVRHGLEQACARKSPIDVELWLILGSEFGLSPSWTPILCTLLEEDWHHSHEDIASTLQNIRAPSSVDPLYRTALVKHDYLAYNDSSALAIKCIWALYDIGTAGAAEKLQLLSNAESQEIREKARERLADLATRRSGDPEEPYRLVRNATLRPDGR